jgi:hypothetical protein
MLYKSLCLAALAAGLLYSTIQLLPAQERAQIYCECNYEDDDPSVCANLYPGSSGLSCGFDSCATPFGVFDCGAAGNDDCDGMCIQN